MKNNRFRCHPSLIIENLGTLIVGIIAILVFNANDFVELFQKLPKVDAGLAASIFHFGELTIPDLKKTLKENNIMVRL